MTVTHEHPAEPVDVDGSTHGGFADVARRLNALHPERSIPISRQLVHRWFKCRNQFPEPQLVKVDGKPKLLFDLAAVERWYAGRAGDPPPIETIPMFQVDRRGQPIVRTQHPIDSEQNSHREHPAVRESYRGSVLDL